MGGILRYREFLKTYKTRGYRINHLESYKYLFPIKSNPKLAGIIADLICDGHLQGEPKWRADFTSKSKEELKRFDKEIKSLFNIKGRIRDCSSNIYGKTYNISMNSSPIARILLLCGVPKGQKVLQLFDVPFWVRKNKECSRRFLQRVFTCEGNLAHRERRIPQIRLEMWKLKKLMNKDSFIKQIQEDLYKYFKVDSVVSNPKNQSVRKDGLITKPTRMYIMNKSVSRFYKEIGFEGEKQQSLKALLNK